MANEFRIKNGLIVSSGTVTLSTFTLPASLGNNGDVLRIPTGGGTTLEWASFTEVSSSGVTAVNNFVANRLTTVGSTTSELDGEANLTFDGSAFQVTGTLTVGVDDTGHDVKFFGATSGSYMLWDESQDDLVLGGAARLGIGTTSPGTSLHLSDAEQVTLSVDSSHSVGSQISLDATGTGGDEWRLISAADGASADAGAFGLYNMDTSAYRLVVKADGNVGIGTTSPATKLHIERNESDAENLMLRLRDSTVNAVGERIGIEGFWNTVPAGDIEFELTNVSSGAAAIVFSPHSGSSTKNEAMRIASDGKVGIGTTSPQSLLEIRAAAGSPGTLTLSTSEPTVVDGDKIGRIDFNAPSEADGTDAILVGASIWAEADATYAADNNRTELVFATGASEAAAERMRVTFDGKLGIGTSTPSRALDVNGDIVIRGNDILDSGVAAAITFDGSQNTTIAGDLTVSGNDIKDSGGTVITFDGSQNVTLAGDLTLAEAKAIYFDSTDTSITTNSENPEDLFISADQDLFLRPDNDVLVQVGTTTYAIFDGGNQRVGIGTTSPAALLDLRTGSGFALISGADVNATSLTDDTRKFVRFGLPHYDTDEEPVTILTADSESGYSRVSIGGGTSAGNAPSQIFFHTGANTTTLGNNSATAAITSTGLGIGTTSPAFPLHLKYTDNDTGPEGGHASGASGTIGASAQGGGLYIENASTTDGAYAGITFRTDSADARIAYQSVGSGLNNEGQMSFFLDTNDTDGGSPDAVFTLEEVLRLRAGSADSDSNLAYNLAYVNGRLGVGVSDPDKVLEVNAGSTNLDGIKIEGSGVNTSLTINNTGTSGGKYRISVTSGSHGDGTNKLLIQDNNTARITLNGSGDVGIGDTSPAEKLQVAGNIRINNNAAIKADGSGYMILGNTNGGQIRLLGDGSVSRVRGDANHLQLETARDQDDIIFAVNKGGTDGDDTVVEAMRIEGDSAFVGIGTNDPDKLLHVVGASNDDTVALFSTAGGTGGSTQGTVHIGLSHFSSDANPSVRIGAEENGTGSYQAALTFGTRSATSDAAPAERMRITHDGDVGIGTTDPASLLHVGSTAYELSSGAYLVSSQQRTAKVVIHADDSNTNWYSQEIGLALHNEDPTNNNWSPHIAFTTHEDDDGNPANANPVAVAAISATYNTRVANGWAKGDLVFFTNNAGSGNAERMRITGAGNVEITGDLTVSGKTITSEVETVSTSNGVVFEGSASNSNELLLKAGTVSTDRTITLPDATGTVALTSDIGDALTLANGADNRIVTATGSAALNGEANLTFNGSTLALTGDFNVGSGDLFVDDSSGRVGIGTGSPSVPLHVSTTLTGNDATTLVGAEVFRLDSIDDGSSSGGPGFSIRLESTNDHNSPNYEKVIMGDGGSMRVKNIHGNYGFSEWYLAGNADGKKPIMSITSGGSTSAGQAQDGILQLYSTTDAWAANTFSPTNNTTKVKLDAGGDSYFTGGDVGIGTTSPEGVLEIEQATTTGHALKVYRNQSSSNMDSSLVFLHDDSQYADEVTLHVKQDGTGYAGVFEGGNVGIGTTAPDEALEIMNGVLKITREETEDSSVTEDTVTLSPLNGLRFNYSIAFDNNNPVRIGTDSDQDVAIRRNAGDKHRWFWNDSRSYLNMSVEKGTPTLAFRTTDTDIAANDVLGQITFGAPYEGTGTDALLDAGIIKVLSEGDFSASSNASAMTFSTGASEAATEKMRLTSAGRLGIATTSPEGELHVAGSMIVDYAVAHGGQSGQNRMIFGNNTQTFQTSGTDRFTLADTVASFPNSSLGIGTTTAPHGGVGKAVFAIDGTNANTAGPHIQYTTASDDHPLFQQLNWTHDNIAMSFDAYYDGSWKSSDVGSNFQIYKLGDFLNFRYDSGISQGSAVSWNNGLTISNAGAVNVPGAFSATTKSFVIEHPTKEGMTLEHGSLEGPEHGVYVRGKLERDNVIELPDYWTGLVDADSVSVQLTPNKTFQQLYVEKIEDNKVYVKNMTDLPINCFFFIQAERKDIDKMVVEY